MLDEVLKEYDTHKSDMYNIDKKGIQLGVGRQVVTIVG
jgi:hypothetical protein